MLTGHLGSLDFSYLTVFPLSLSPFHRAKCVFCAWCEAGLHGDLEFFQRPIWSGVGTSQNGTIMHPSLPPINHAPRCCRETGSPWSICMRLVCQVFASGLLLCCRYRPADGADVAHGGSHVARWVVSPCQSALKWIRSNFGPDDLIRRELQSKELLRASMKRQTDWVSFKPQ